MKSEQLVHLFHILIVGTLFLYVGLRRNKMPQFMYPVLIVVGAIVLLYHAISMVKNKGKRAWINLIHIVLVVPLLAYIGYKNKETSRKFYELLLMLGFASIGYHGLYMVRAS